MIAETTSHAAGGPSPRPDPPPPPPPDPPTEQPKGLGDLFKLLFNAFYRSLAVVLSRPEPTEFTPQVEIEGVRLVGKGPTPRAELTEATKRVFADPPGAVSVSQDDIGRAVLSRKGGSQALGQINANGVLADRDWASFKRAAKTVKSVVEPLVPIANATIGRENSLQKAMPQKEKKRDFSLAQLLSPAGMLNVFASACFAGLLVSIFYYELSVASAYAARGFTKFVGFDYAGKAGIPWLTAERLAVGLCWIYVVGGFLLAKAVGDSLQQRGDRIHKAWFRFSAVFLLYASVVLYAWVLGAPLDHDKRDSRSKPIWNPGKIAFIGGGMLVSPFATSFALRKSVENLDKVFDLSMVDTAEFAESKEVLRDALMALGSYKAVIQQCDSVLEMANAAEKQVVLRSELQLSADQSVLEARMSQAYLNGHNNN